MKRLKNITILLCFLSLLAFISCSAEDKTGINNPPEDTEITDGETGSGGTGSSSGGSSETEECGGGTRTFSYYAGNWFCISEESGEVNFFTINADGSLILKSLDGSSETSVLSTSIIKNSDTSYTYHAAEKNTKTHFNFTSDTEGTITFEDVRDGSSGSGLPVTKK